MRPSACCGRATGRIPRRASPGRPRMPTCSSCCSIGRRTRPCAGRSSPTTLRSFMAFRVGLIGLGMAVTPHAKSLLDLRDRVEVAYAYSRSAERRAKFKQSFPFPQTARLEDILEDSSVDAVLVLTPPNTHLDLVQRCAASGKHVLLEKPVEISASRAEKLVEISRKNGIRLGVVLQHRFRPAAERLRGLLAAGKLGELVSACASIPVWRPQSYYDQPGRGTRAREASFTNGKNLEVKTESGGGGTGADPMAFPHDWHRSLLADFIDAIERGREPRVNGEEALKVHRLIDRLLQSAG